MSDHVDTYSDTSLVAALARGHQRALAQIYHRYGATVWALARRVCRDPDLAQDVTQTVFTHLWSRPERFDPARGTLRVWLVTQAHARAVDTVRSEAARRRRDQLEARLARPCGARVGVEPEKIELGIEVRQALDELPAPERDAIMVAYYGGHTYRETAALLGQSEGTTKARIRAGLQRLRAVLTAQGVTP